jgi:hypothetical protein
MRSGFAKQSLLLLHNRSVIQLLHSAVPRDRLPVSRNNVLLEGTSIHSESGLALAGAAARADWVRYIGGSNSPGRPLYRNLDRSARNAWHHRCISRKRCITHGGVE